MKFHNTMPRDQGGPPPVARVLLSAVITLILTVNVVAAQLDQDQSQQFSLSDRSYIHMNGKWYTNLKGSPGDEINLHSLVIHRKSEAGPISDSELADHGLTRVKELPLGYIVVSVDEAEDPFAVAAGLEASQFYVEFDAMATFQSEPNDFYYTPVGDYLGQWNLVRIGMPAAWSLTRGSEDIVVAISDKGVDYVHEDLAHNLWTNVLEIPDNGLDDDFNQFIDDQIGWDFRFGDNDPSPLNASGTSANSHGTNVAGIINGHSNNIIGVAGIAGGWAGQNGAQMMALRSDQDLSNLLESVVYAVQNGAHVVNMSWTTFTNFSHMEDIFEYLTANYDAILIGAAGNTNDLGVGYPAAYDGTIAVSSTRFNDQYGDDAFGPELDLVAPKSVLTTDVTGEPGTNNLDIFWDIVNGVFSLDYNPLFGGTSSAAPHVSGTAALMLSLNPGLSPAQAKSVLQDSAEKVWPTLYDYNWDPLRPGHSVEMGYGRLRADSALLQAQTTPTLEILMPNGGESHATGETLAITWQRRSFSGSVRLELHNADGFVQTIASSVSGSAFSWSIPSGLAARRDYRVKVSATSNSTIADFSDRSLAIGRAVTLGESFALAVGQTVDVATTQLTLTFDGVNQDSRCPVDVFCKWEGRAEVDFTVQIGAATPAEILFSVPPGRGTCVGLPEGYTIYIEELEPEAISTQTIDPEDYIATVRVEVGIHC